MTSHHATRTLQQTIEQFNNALNRHDTDGLLSMVSDDIVFESTGPAPAGERYVGRDAMRGFFETFFTGSPNAVFETEDEFATGDRAVVNWRYTWDPNGDSSGDPGWVRGVSIFRGSHGKVTEVLAYVKG